MPFSLLTEPWLPVIGTDGSRTTVSLEQLLLNPSAWAAIDTVQPGEFFALHRLLLAICHRAIGPGDAGQRAELLDTWPAERITAYFQRWADRFDLFDAKRPFLQLPAIEDFCQREKGKAKQFVLLAKLRPYLSTGTQLTLWDRTLDSNPEAVSAAEAARVLVSHLQTPHGGTIQLIGHSGSFGPANNRNFVIPLGATLQETLGLNLIPQSPADYAVDVPAWEADLPEIEVLKSNPGRVPNGPADRYTFLSRSVLLIPDEELRVTRTRYGTGYSVLPSPVLDPMTAAVQGKDGPIEQRINLQRAFWRDLGAMVGTEGSAPPATVRHAADLRIALGDYDPLELAAGGFAWDTQRTAKALGWRLEFRHLAPQLLTDPMAVSTIEAALELATSTRTALYGPLMGMCSDWLSQGNSTNGGPDAARLYKSIGPDEFYWARLESDFWLFVHQLGAGDGADACLGAWSKTIRQTVAATWDHARDSLGLDGRALAAAGRNTGRLGAVLASIGGSTG